MAVYEKIIASIIFWQISAVLFYFTFQVPFWNVMAGFWGLYAGYISWRYAHSI